MKLHFYLFLLLIVFLPTQLALHFWPNFSFVSGIRIDYLSPTLFFTDILLIATIVTWLLQEKNIKLPIDKNIIFLIALFSIINIVISLSPILTFYKWVKVLEFSLLGLYVSKNINKTNLEHFKFALSFSALITSLIGLLQFLNHSSLNGLFYYLGERSFTALTPGIALFSFGNKMYLRPYATFPHPNVFAAFLLITFLVMVNRKIFSIIFCLFLSAFILLSFSLNAWVTLLTIGIIYLFKNQINKFSSLLPLFFISTSLAFSAKASNLLDTASQMVLSNAERIKLAVASIFIWQKSFIFGVGLGTFIISLSDVYYSYSDKLGDVGRYWLQPVHNIYLLIASELGIIGLLFLYYFLVKIFTYKNLTYRSYLLVLALLLLGLNDHYLFTLQQGQLITNLIIGLSFSNSLVE